MRMHATSHHARVAGVDGCRNGWVIASNNECIVVRALDEVIERFDLIGVDMPIGLLREGTRQCDADAGVGRGLARRRPAASQLSP